MQFAAGSVKDLGAGVSRRGSRHRLSCPNCKNQVEPQARYCPACYTVFPSNSPNRNLSATRAEARSSRGPALFFAVILLGWGGYVIMGDDATRDRPYADGSNSIRQTVVRWFAQATAPGSAHSAPGQRQAEQRPAWQLANGDRIPCAPGSKCDAVIRFDSGTAADYIVDRPNDGGTRILAVDDRGAGLLKSADRGNLIVSAPRGTSRSVPIVRTYDGRWSAVHEDQGSDKTNAEGVRR